MNVTLVDFNDSFTWNIFSILKEMDSNLEIEVVNWLEFEVPVKKSVVVLGPGPGHPNEYAKINSKIRTIIEDDSIYLIGNFIKSVINKKNLILKSNIKTVRSYMHEEDLARCTLEILNLNKTDGKIYNVGSDDEIDAKYLANKLSKKYSLKLIHKKINEKKIDYYVPDIKKIKKELNFKLNSSSYKSIIKTINFLKN